MMTSLACVVSLMKAPNLVASFYRYNFIARPTPQGT